MQQVISIFDLFGVDDTLSIPGCQSGQEFPVPPLSHGLPLIGYCAKLCVPKASHHEKADGENLWLG
ncbi:hypothetical protein ACFLYX_04260 [Chloroflexota bacterium]